jgi:hypothetical protein
MKQPIAFQKVIDCEARVARHGDIGQHAVANSPANHVRAD